MSFNGVHSITQIKWLWAMIPFTLHLRMHLTVIKCSVMRSGGYYVSVLEDVLQCEQSSGLKFPVWSRDTTPRTICSLNASKYVQRRLSQWKQQEVDQFLHQPKVNRAGQMFTITTCLQTRSEEISSRPPRSSASDEFLAAGDWFRLSLISLPLYHLLDSRFVMLSGQVALLSLPGWRAQGIL